MSSLHDLVAAVAHAVAALNAAVAETGFDTTVDDTELHTSVIALEKTKSALEVGASRVLQRWDARHVWAPGGHRSAAARLSRDANISTPTAQRELRRARTIAALPTASAAVTVGQLSVDHLDLLARANQPHRTHLFERDEATLVAECTRLRWADSVRAVDYWCQRADADGDGRADRSDRTALYTSPTIDGTIALNGTLDPIGGEIVLGELTRLERDIYLTDCDNGVERTGAQRRAAALIEMARRSATAPANGRRPKPLFTVHVGDHTARHLCELAGGTVVHPDDLADWVDDALLETVLFDGPTTVLSVSQQRSFTGVLRRAVEARDRHCTHPSGCDVPAPDCDVDHIVPHSTGGPTSQFNGRLQCRTHNRNANKHDHGATPAPDRRVHRLDTFRARIRWQLLRQPDEPAGHPSPAGGTAETGRTLSPAK